MSTPADLPTVSDASFEADVLRSSLPVLVEFGADWCPPCRQLEPILHEIAHEWEGKLRLATLDIDANADTTMRFGVMGVPTLILFRGGQELERWTGFQPKKKLVERLGSHLR